MNPVERFFDSANRGDFEAMEAAFHPEFEMIVPQHPARGFKGRDQEIKNMRFLHDTHPEGRIQALRMVEAPPEIWVESNFIGDGLEMAAVVIFEIDPETDSIIRGRYYSEPVDKGGPGIDEWMHALPNDVR